MKEKIVDYINSGAYKKLPGMILKYIKVWWLMSRNSFAGVLSSRGALAIFLFGKTLRFIFFFVFLFYLLKGTKTLAGYDLNQVLFFFLTFNVVDIVSQFLFREVYRFRPLVVTGGFDMVLVKPVNALFRSLMGGADVIDLITIPPLLFALYYVGSTFSPSAADVFLYVLLLLSGLLISTAFHIAVLSLGIITLEVDNTVMIYRDFVNLGKLPVDVYKEPVKGLLTYILPVGLMITLPAKAIMGLVSFQGIFMSLFISCVLIILSIKFWRFALLKYSSASS